MGQTHSEHSLREGEKTAGYSPTSTTQQRDPVQGLRNAVKIDAPISRAVAVVLSKGGQDTFASPHAPVSQQQFQDIVDLPKSLSDRIYHIQCASKAGVDLTVTDVVSQLTSLLEHELRGQALPDVREYQKLLLGQRDDEAWDQKAVHSLLDDLSSAWVAGIMGKDGMQPEDMSVRIKDLVSIIFTTASPTITTKDLANWLHVTMPHTLDFIPRHIAGHLLSQLSVLQSETSSPSPPVSNPLLEFVGSSEIISPGVAWMLSNILGNTSHSTPPRREPAPALNEAGEEVWTAQTPPRWEVLYSARKHGYSMNRFEYYTLKYSNPTLLLISGSTDMKKSSGSSKSVPIVIGAYVSSPWKKSKQYWGNSDTILFQVEPRPSVHTAGTKTPVASSVKGNPVVPPPGSENYCYLNADAIGFGGTVNHFEFWTDLNRARFGPSIDEKAPGRLSSPIFGGWSDNVEFEVEDVEIIGLGTAHASAQQRREWNVDARAAERRQGVNVNDRDVARTVLAMAGVVPEERPE